MSSSGGTGGAPVVTVVMAAFNSETTVAAAVSSVLWQTWAALELVVVDDGSTDGTAEVLASFRDPRVKVLRQSNAGAGAARNHAMSQATGQLISFLDSDDLLFGDHVRALVDVWGGRPRTIATANSFWLLPGGIDPSHTRHKGRFPRPEEQRLALLEQNFLSPMSLFPRSMVDEIGGFDTGLRRSEDWDFWLRAVYAGYRVVHQERPLSLFRWGAGSMSTARDLVFEAEDEILRRVQARGDLLPAERGYLTRRLASPAPRLLSNEGDAALRDRRWSQAAQRYAAAAALSPSEQMLVRKARLMRLAPALFGPLLRARQLRREGELGFDPSFEH